MLRFWFEFVKPGRTSFTCRWKMALVDRKMKLRFTESEPLIQAGDIRVALPTVTSLEADEGQTKRSTALWKFDVLFLLLDYAQLYSVLLIMSEQWGWPIQWIEYTQFSLLINLDIWGFLKVQTGAFDHSRISFANTDLIGLNYITYLILWYGIIIIFSAIFFYIYWKFRRTKPLYLLLFNGNWKRKGFYILQAISLPFGIAVTRIYQCHHDERRSLTVLVADQNFECYTPLHYILMVIISLSLLLVFILYPLYIHKQIHELVYCSDGERHEAYLQLKETEYEKGLDILWLVGSFYYFSSFKRKWANFQPWKFFLKLLIIIAVACSIQFEFWSSLALCLLFGFTTLAFLCQKPYRVGHFNHVLIISCICLLCNAIVGIFLVLPPWENAGEFVIVSFLRYPSIVYVLLSINLYWLSVIIIWLLYLTLKQLNIIRDGLLLWPKLSQSNSGEIRSHTERFMRAVLIGRQTLERAQCSLPLFAPIYELSDQIQIINACCREAEYLQDTTHDTLWDLLDELIECHNKLRVVSLFGASTKSSAHETSRIFLQLMPNFARRLQQREYDLILVNPVRKRMLLKLYTISLFLNGKKSKVDKGTDVGTKVTEFLKRYETNEDPFEDVAATSSSVVDTISRPTTSSGSLSSDTTLTNGQKINSMTAFIDQVDAWTNEHPNAKDSVAAFTMQKNNKRWQASSDSGKCEMSTNVSREGTISQSSLPEELTASPCFLK